MALATRARIAVAALACTVCAGAIVAALRPRPRTPAAAPGPPHFARTFELAQLRRGNIHTHTNLSDGHSPPEDVARWYREHGYQFLAITDHNLVTADELVARLSSPEFVILRGEEISMYQHGKQTHVNAVCSTRTIGGGEFPNASDALARAIRLVREQHAIAIINHPNFDSAIAPADIPSFAGAHMIEIFSGHEFVNWAGDETHPSHEQLWDMALGAGLDVMGVAVDDMHCLQSPGDPPAYPGKGWVYVSTPVLDAPSICAALASGQLVSSNGPSLQRIAISVDRYDVQADSPSAVVTFLGAGGRVLATGASSYSLRGDEGYVRARVDSPDGKHAWTPAVRVVR